MVNGFGHYVSDSSSYQLLNINILYVIHIQYSGNSKYGLCLFLNFTLQLAAVLYI